MSTLFSRIRYQSFVSCFIGLAVFTLVLSSCKKEDNTPHDTISMKVDGVDWSGPGQIASTNITASANGQNINIVMFNGIKTGTFSFLSFNASGLFRDGNGHELTATSGELTITNTNPVSGTFHMVVKDLVGTSGLTMTITDGVIDEVQ